MCVFSYGELSKGLLRKVLREPLGESKTNERANQVFEEFQKRVLKNNSNKFRIAIGHKKNVQNNMISKC